MAESSNYISVLPDDAIIEIVKQLDYKSYTRLCETSKQFKQFCESYHTYFCKFFLQSEGYNVSNIPKKDICSFMSFTRYWEGNSFQHLPKTRIMIDLLKNKTLPLHLFKYLFDTTEYSKSLESVLLSHSNGIIIGNKSVLDFLSNRYKDYRNVWNVSTVLHYIVNNDFKNLKQYHQTIRNSVNTDIFKQTILESQSMFMLQYFEKKYNMDVTTLWENSRCEDCFEPLELYIKLILKNNYDVTDFFEEMVDKLFNNSVEFFNYINYHFPNVEDEEYEDFSSDVKDEYGAQTSFVNEDTTDSIRETHEFISWANFYFENNSIHSFAIRKVLDLTEEHQKVKLAKYLYTWHQYQPYMLKMFISWLALEGYIDVLDSALNLRDKEAFQSYKTFFNKLRQIKNKPEQIASKPAYESGE